MSTEARKLLEAKLFEAQAAVAKLMRGKPVPGQPEADKNLTLSQFWLQEAALIARLREIQDAQRSR
jgi:hypothetical protein